MVKKLDSIEEKVQKGELLKKKLYSWCIRLLQKHEQVTKPRIPAAPASAAKVKYTNFYEKYSRDNLAPLFEEVCSIFHLDLDEAKDYDVDAVMDDVNRSNANEEM